jgi:large repetitive protein
VLFSMGTNGIDFNPLSITSLGNNLYESSTLPNLQGSLYHFKLEVIDQAGNKLTQIFQMPGGIALSTSIGVSSDSEIPKERDFSSEPLVLNTSESMGCSSASGSINLTVSGGVSPYSIVWNGPNNFYSNDEDINNLVSGTYQVTVSDALGQNQSKSVEVPVYLPTTISGTVEKNYSSINVSVTGTGPFTFSWVGPDGFSSTNQNLSGLTQPGQYTLTVTNANGCSAIKSFYLNQSIQLTHKLSRNCMNQNGNSIELSVSGGQAPYVYSWTGPNGYSSKVKDISNVAPGNYLVTVTDSSNQSSSLAVPIDTVAPFNPTFIVSQSTLPNFNNGSITAIAKGGFAPYTYAWSTGTIVGPISSVIQTQNNFSGSNSVSYSLTVSDSKGCSKSFTGIKVLKKLEVSSWSGPNCTLKTRKNSIVLNTTGGHGALSYSWKKNGISMINNSNVFIAPTGAAQYQITVSDSEGQTASADVSLPKTTLPLQTLSAVITPTKYKTATGSMTVSVAGGIGPYTFTINPAKNYSNLEDNSIYVKELEARSYSVKVQTSLGCSVTKSFRVPWIK